LKGELMAAAFDYRSVMKPKSFLTVFNPGDEIKKDYNGNTYTFPANGEVDVYETVGKKYNKEGFFEDFQIPAEEVVSHFIGDDGVSGHLGPLGVRVLSGDPEIDEKIREEARTVNKERAYLNDLAIRNAHMAAVRVAKEGGNPPPSPERYVVEAFKRIEAYEAGGNRALPFACPDCNMQFLTGDEVPRHQEAQHKTAPVVQSSGDDSLKAALVASAAQVAALTEIVTKLVAKQAEPKNKGGRPRKVQESAA
jgi:hypothetical protein